MATVMAAEPALLPTGSPVLILGMAPRSGTNLLYRLLEEHPELDCVAVSTMPEDFLIFHSDLLLRYADLVSLWWSGFWQSSDDAAVAKRSEVRSGIAEAVGRSLAASLTGPDPTGNRVVTKTPHIRNVANVFTVFADARVSVLVRGGRDQVESSVRSFDRLHEHAIQRWAEAARVVLRFNEQHRKQKPKRHLVVRYEDLVLQEQSALENLFDFLGLCSSRYDLTALEILPVLGSSEHLASGQLLTGSYPIVKAAPDFNSLTRWRSWPGRRLARVKYVCRPVWTGVDRPALGNVYGPRQDPAGEAGVISIFLQHLLAGRDVTIFGDGEQTRDNVYVADVLDAFVRSIDGPSGERFNVGTGLPTSVNDLYRTIAEVLGTDLQALYAPHRTGELHHNTLDPSRAHRKLSWQARTTLQAGLQETAASMGCRHLQRVS